MRRTWYTGAVVTHPGAAQLGIATTHFHLLALEKREELGAGEAAIEPDRQHGRREGGPQLAKQPAQQSPGPTKGRRRARSKHGRDGELLDLLVEGGLRDQSCVRMEHTISAGATLCASGFEVRAWVARPEQAGGRLAARPIPDEVSRKLKGGSA